METRAALAMMVLAITGCSIGGSLPWQNPKLPVERRVEDLLRRMTPEEKLKLLGNVAIPRLGIQAIRPAGGKRFRAGAAVASTWNPDLASQEARAVAQEALAAGFDQIPGPPVESYGEDPFLAARMAVAYVGAMQGEGVIVTLEHFGATADERALQEIYYPPFRAAVEEAGAWSVTPAPGYESSVVDVLEKDWGFKGFVVSTAPIKGDNPDDGVRRILRARFASGMFERTAPAASPDHGTVARDVANQSIVLLKNDGQLLPLDAGKAHSIAVIGPVHGVRERAALGFQANSASGSSIGEAVDLARKSAIAIVNGSDDLIQAVAKANKNTIVVADSASLAHVNRWANQVPAIIGAWDEGNGIGDVLFGGINPSGKLPVTVAKDPNEISRYDGIFTGYRYFDRHGIEPLFPFGHGLSYTTFAYSDLRIFPQTPRYGQLVEVVVRIRNSGSRAGAEVIQLYIHQVKSSVERPVKELKAFRRIELKPGEVRDVTFELDRRSMWFYDPAVKDWAAQPGVFDVLVGASSSDIRLRGSFELFE